MSWLPCDEFRCVEPCREALRTSGSGCAGTRQPRWLAIGSGRAARWFLFAVVLLAVRVDAAAEDLLGPIRNPILLPEATEFLQGFTVLIQVPEETSAGYVPVKIILAGRPQFTADRRFVFRFRSEPQLGSPPQNGLEVDVPILVNQGTSTEAFIRYLPKWSAGQAVSVSVSEEGRAMDGYVAFFGGETLKMPPRTRFQRYSSNNRRLLSPEYKMNWLFLSENDDAVPGNLPDLTDLLYADGTSISSRMELGPDGLSRFWSMAMAGSDLQAIGQKKLPTDWRGYQRFDTIVMSPEGLRRLRSNDSAYQAIRDWVLNGGTVVVYNAVSAPEIVDELGFTWSSSHNTKTNEFLNSVVYDLTNQWQQDLQQTQLTVQGFEQSVRQLQEQVAAARAMQAAADTGAEPMEPATDVTVNVPNLLPNQLPMTLPDEFTAEALNAMSSGDPAFLDDQVKASQDELLMQQERLARLKRKLNTPSKTWVDQIQIQGAGAGYVITIKPESGRETPTEAHWRIVNSFLDHRASPTVRRGVDPLIGDRRFGRWMIPGVAQPPVYTFMGLLTAFVILVGPIAYRRTSKMGRSYLMFAIAPILALLTTVAMFGYGIVSDGFGTMVRVRQLTWVDGKSGNAGERVRSTYFAGVRPADGLRFSGDAELMIYHEGRGMSWEDLDNLTPAMLGQVTVEEDAQRLDATFLPSRQQCQFVTHAPRNDVGYLELIPDPDGIQPPEVASGFAFPLQQAVLRDQDSNYWLIENLAPNSVSRTTPLTTRDASKMLGQLYNDHRLLSEVRETRSTQNRYDNQIYDVILDIHRVLGSKVTITDGLFEAWLQQNLQTNGEIPNQHFVAISDVSPDVLAVEGCELKSSIRYVFGTLR